MSQYYFVFHQIVHHEKFTYTKWIFIPSYKWIIIKSICQMNRSQVSTRIDVKKKKKKDKWDGIFTSEITATYTFSKSLPFYFIIICYWSKIYYISNKQDASGIKLLIWTVNENKVTWALKMFSFMLIHCRQLMNCSLFFFPWHIWDGLHDFEMAYIFYHPL